MILSDMPPTPPAITASAFPADRCGATRQECTNRFRIEATEVFNGTLIRVYDTESADYHVGTICVHDSKVYNGALCREYPSVDDAVEVVTEAYLADLEARAEVLRALEIEV